MREILFKAKRIDNGEWVEGDYSQFCDVHYIHVRLWSLPLEKYLKYKTSEFEVDPNTICQFTGLTDKNGKKIWENDICDRKEEYPEIVKYHEGDFTLDYSYAVGKDEGYNWCNLGFYVCQRKVVEVIGNIFDNPELLKKKSVTRR